MAHVFAFFPERLYYMDEELSQDRPFMTNDVPHHLAKLLNDRTPLNHRMPKHFLA